MKIYMSILGIFIAENWLLIDVLIIMTMLYIKEKYDANRIKQLFSKK